MQINGVNYHVEVSGSGPALVLLHGFTGSSVNWADLSERWSGQFTVIAPDILGHGKTDSPGDWQRYTMEHVAADIVAIIKQLRDDRVHLLGYSMGGRLALYITTYYPQMLQSLIVESSSPGLHTESERRLRRESDEKLMQRILEEGIPRFVDFWESIPLFESQKNLPASVSDQLRAQRLHNNPLGLANSLRGMGTGSQPSLWAQISTLQVPTLLLTGELDTKFTQIAHQMHACVPNASLEIISNAGHTIHLEQPAHYFDLVSEFLSTHG